MHYCDNLAVRALKLEENLAGRTVLATASEQVGGRSYAGRGRPFPPGRHGAAGVVSGKFMKCLMRNLIWLVSDALFRGLHVYPSRVWSTSLMHLITGPVIGGIPPPSL